MTTKRDVFLKAANNPKFGSQTPSIRAIATVRFGVSLDKIVEDFKNGQMHFIAKNLLTGEQWEELNEFLWNNGSVRFVEHDGKMRLTRVSSPELMHQTEEDSRGTRPNATVAETVDATHRAIQRDDHYHAQEMYMIKKSMEK